jgi:hypothetical protein
MTTRQLAGWQYNEVRIYEQEQEARRLLVKKNLATAVMTNTLHDSKADLLRQWLEAYPGDRRVYETFDAQVAALAHLRDSKSSRAVTRGLKVDSLDLGSMRADGQRNYRHFLKVVHKVMELHGAYSIVSSERALSSASGLSHTSVSRYLATAQRLGHLEVTHDGLASHSRRIVSLIEASDAEVSAVEQAEKVLEVELGPDPELIQKNNAATAKHRAYLAKASRLWHYGKDKAMALLQMKKAIFANTKAAQIAEAVSLRPSEVKASFGPVAPISDIEKRRDPGRWRQLALAAKGLD